jgi:cell division protein FtsA
MAKKEDLLVGLDIGTTKICAVVGEPTREGIDIVGIGTHPSVGLRKGVVVDIESTVNSIKRAVEEAELMAGCEINSIYAGIAGGHIQGFNSQGVIAIKSREVTQQDIDRVIDAAKAVAIPFDREVIHIIPQEFIIDDQTGIHNPLGMSGVRLEARVHIVTGAVTSAQNIVKCCNRAGLDVCDIVLESLASAEAVLTPQERKLGVALVDFGGGTCDLAIFADSSIRHTSVLSLGGNNLTQDIAVGLRTPIEEAEKIKQRFGCAVTSMIQKDETIQVPSVGGGKPRVLSRKILGEIIEPRIEEICTLLHRAVMRSGCLETVASGVVFTGGAASLPGLNELAEQIFNLPVRTGSPNHVGGLADVVRNPMYATGVGLVLYALRSKPKKHFRIRQNNIFNRLVDRMRRWFADIV